MRFLQKSIIINQKSIVHYNLPQHTRECKTLSLIPSRRPMSTSPLIQGEILESEMSEINEDNNIQAELHQLSIMARTVLDMLENEDKTPTPLTAHFQSKPMISERSDQQDDRSQFTAGKIETARRKKNGEYGHNTVNTTQYFPSSLSSHSPTTSNNRKQLIKIVHNITN